jgi:hypothetical protein
MQATRGEEIQLLLILDLGTRWVSSQRLAPAVHYPREKTPGTHWIEGWVGSELVWTQRLEEKSFASAGDRALVAMSSSL